MSKLILSTLLCTALLARAAAAEPPAITPQAALAIMSSKYLRVSQIALGVAPGTPASETGAGSARREARAALAIGIENITEQPITLSLDASCKTLLIDDAGASWALDEVAGLDLSWPTAGSRLHAEGAHVVFTPGARQVITLTFSGPRDAGGDAYAFSATLVALIGDKETRLPLGLADMHETRARRTVPVGSTARQ